LLRLGGRRGRTAVRPYKRVFTTSGGVWEPIVPPALRGEPRRAPVGYILLPSPPAPLPPTGEWNIAADMEIANICSAFPLARLRERGTQGVRAIQRACPFTLALEKIAPASKTSCRTVVPLPPPRVGAYCPPVVGANGCSPLQGRARNAQRARLKRGRRGRTAVRPDKGVFPTLIGVHRLGAVCAGRARFRPHSQPLSHAVGEGSRARTCVEC